MYGYLCVIIIKNVFITYIRITLIKWCWFERNCWSNVSKLLRKCHSIENIEDSNRILLTQMICTDQHECISLRVGKTMSSFYRSVHLRMLDSTFTICEFIVRILHDECITISKTTILFRSSCAHLNYVRFIFYLIF